ncbi:unnamed protein product, partial [Meganyctiphanes norvegica]
ISEAKVQQSGNYTCAPSNVLGASISVHILDGEYPAAIQHGESCVTTFNPRVVIALLLLYILLVYTPYWPLQPQHQANEMSNNRSSSQDDSRLMLSPFPGDEIMTSEKNIEYMNTVALTGVCRDDISISTRNKDYHLKLVTNYRLTDK